MYTIILLSILAVVGLLAGWLIDKYTYADGWSFTFGDAKELAGCYCSIPSDLELEKCVTLG